MALQPLELFYLKHLNVSNILITPIKIGSTSYCLRSTGLTDPILSGMASNDPKMPGTVSGNDSFNVYQANPDGDPGSDDGYRSQVKTGQIIFGVHPCAQKIDFHVVGRRDVYFPGDSFDTCVIIIDGVQVKRYANVGERSSPKNPTTGIYVPPLDGIDSLDEVFTHTFSSDIPCGHKVVINGQSGNLANDNVGYDVQINVTV